MAEHKRPAQFAAEAPYPIQFFCGQIERGDKPGLLPNKTAPEGNRIDAGLVRQLVDGTFNGKNIIVGSDSAA